jgi:hydroxymethylglutaryl-CoA lyase
MQAMRSIRATALAAHLNVVVYVSMAFGNPYGDAWSTGAVTEACTQLVDMGIAQISLADTVGLASAAQISETVESVLGTNKQTEIGVHLHTRPEQAAENIRSAYRAGCRRFDGAIGGLGGCPFAQDDLVGNIPTEVLLAELKKLGASLPLLQNLDALVRANAEIAARFGG